MLHLRSALLLNSQPAESTKYFDYSSTKWLGYIGRELKGASVVYADQPQMNGTRELHHCSFVLHGLNTNPNKMSDLADLSRQSGFKAKIGILSGHHPIAEEKSQNQISAEVWQSEFKQQWSEAMSDCTDRHSERLFIGYSLGALTGMSVFDGESNLIAPTKMILISPALSLRKITYLIRSISWLPFGFLPSLNHPDYRARDHISLKNYKALFKIHDEWQNHSWTHTGSIKTLLVLSPRDELVNSQDLQKQLEQRHLTQWSLKWITNEDSTLRPRYDHLIIDSVSQGRKQWGEFEQTAKTFIKDETNGR